MFHTKVLEKIVTHFLFNNFFSEHRAVCEVMWENMVGPDRPEATIQDRSEKMRFVCWITAARIQTH
jgi:hypothetical protein